MLKKFKKPIKNGTMRRIKLYDDDVIERGKQFIEDIKSGKLKKRVFSDGSVGEY
jgi:hypothetical protein